MEEEGLNLLDACLDDLAFGRYICERSSEIKNLVNFQELEYNNSILHFVAYNDVSDAVEMLLSYGANPNIRNINEETPIHWATSMGSLKSLSILVKGGGNINIQDASGGTALHTAAILGNPEAVPFLLNNGCDDTILDADGHTALDIVRKNNGPGYSAVDFILTKHKNTNKDRYIPKLIDVPKRRGGHNAEIPAVEIQVDPQMLHQSASDNGLVTRLDIQTDTYNLNNEILDNNNSNNNINSEKREHPIKNLDIKKGMNNSISSSSLQTNLIMSQSQPLFSPATARKPSTVAFMLSSGRKGGIFFEANDKSESPTKVVAKMKDEKLKAYLNRHKPIVPTLAFPCANMIPYLPPSNISERMDVIITVEQCTDCEEHSMSVWHDPKKYLNSGDALLKNAVLALWQQGYPIRMYAWKVKPNRSRIGAVELTAAVRFKSSTSSSHNKYNKNKSESKLLKKDVGIVNKMRNTINNSSSTSNIIGMLPDKNNDGWYTYTVQSKLGCRAWPNVEIAKKKIVQFVDEALVASGEPYVKISKNIQEGNIKNELQNWAKRVYGSTSAIQLTNTTTNNNNEKDNNDSIARSNTTNPNTTTQSSSSLSSSSSTPLSGSSPFLDVEKVDIDNDYRNNAMQHFMVFDARTT